MAPSNQIAPAAVVTQLGSSRNGAALAPARAEVFGGDQLPSYTDLFGAIDKAEGQEARSVLSPAAYLVDLLQLKDGAAPDTGPGGYHARRPDVGAIPLDETSTFFEVSSLEVSNEVMRALAERDSPGDADQKLAVRLFPAPLPFTAGHERLQLFLDKLGTDLAELYRRYQREVDGNQVARLRLGLSEAEYQLYATAHDSSDGLAALWGIRDGAERDALLAGEVALIRRKLGVSPKELRSALYQDLSEEEISAGVAAGFFINQDPNRPGTYLLLGGEPADGALRLSDGSAPGPGHLDRLMRFVRLSRRLKLDPADLDWLLQSACARRLDPGALWAIAVARDLGARLSMPAGQVSCLWAQPKRHGKGDGAEPADPFDRIFNRGYATAIEDLAQGGFTEALAGRLVAALGLSRADYAFLAEALDQRGAAASPTVPYFALLYRMASLAKALSLGVQELVALLDVLDAQWETSAHRDLAGPVPRIGGAASGPRPSFTALCSPGAPPRETLDALQRVVRLKEWLDLRQMTVKQLAFICLDGPGRGGGAVEGVAPSDVVEAALSELYQALRSMLLEPAQVQAGSMTQRGGRAAFDALREARVLEVVPTAGTGGADSPRALIRRQPSAEELASALREGIQDLLEVYPADLASAGIAPSGIVDLVDLLQERGYLEAVDGQLRVPPAVSGFFLDPANLSHFYLPELDEHQQPVFEVLAQKARAFTSAAVRLGADAAEISARLVAAVDAQARTLQRILAAQLSLADDLAGALFDFVFGTPDESPTQTLAGLTVPLFELKALGGAAAPALANASLAARFRRLQQFALLAGKAGFTAGEAAAYLDNQHVHRDLPETLQLPEGFIQPPATLDAVVALDGGDVLATSGPRQARLSGRDGRCLDMGTLDQIPGLPLPASFVSGIDCAWRDADGTISVCAGAQFVSSGALLTPRRIADAWGKVRNLIQQDRRVDAAFQDERGRVFLFRGDQYVRYSDPATVLAGGAFVDEGYPRSIRSGFEREQVALLPGVMNARVDAAFRDSDGSYYFFSGDKFTHSADPYALRSNRGSWGIVRNRLFDDDRVDAAFVAGDRTYLVRADQLIRYTGGAYGFTDEGFPISFGNIPEEDPLLPLLRRFPNGIDTAMVGTDGALHVFAGGLHSSSSAPDQQRAIRERWGRVRNRFQDLNRVDAALSFGGKAYLFCDDQYVRYSGPGYQYVDEGYPRRTRANWNALEQIGALPEDFPDPVTAAATGKTGDVYFFGGNRYAGPDGRAGAVKDQWARVRNNVERLGRVDASMIDGAGRLYLFSGDQMYRYGSPAQDFADEGYPKLLAGGWAQEGAGWSVPDSFAGGISASLRAADQRVFFFSGTRYARVDAAAAPRSTAQDWGLVRSWISAQGRVSAAFCDPQGRTFLFGGDQFWRYSTASYDSADEGFPLAIAGRWGNLPDAFRSGIDAVLSFPSGGAQRLYLFKGTDYVRYTGGNYAQVDAGYPRPIASGDQVEGAWFRGLAVNLPDDRSSNQPAIAISCAYVDTYLNQPRICLFYYNGADARQMKREYRVDGAGRYGWTGPVRVDGLTEYAPFTRVNTAFVSRDGTLHLFSDQSYASRPAQGGALSTPVPTRDRWGRVWNQLADLGRVDAALDTADGHTYLFCAQQYVRYTGALRPGDADFYVEEGYPKKIASGWAGEGIPIPLPEEFKAEGFSLCREAGGKIHLFKDAGYTFSGNAGAEVPVAARWGRVLNQFAALNRVDAAYRAENDKLYLFCDTQYTRYSGALSPGSPDFYADPGYPRTIAIGWSDEGVAGAMPARFQALGSAVLRDGQQTFVFSEGSFTGSGSGAARPVLEQWAAVRNQIQEANRVDAGLVLGEGSGAVTLVLCGDQYVRYSGGYGGFADEGYPRRLSQLFTEGLPPLPAPLLGGVRAAFRGRDGNLHAFSPPAGSEPQRYFCSAEPAALRSPREKWGVVDNRIHDQGLVNAALLAPDGKLFLFGGDQYVRYSGADRGFVDEGYPKKVAPAWASEIHAGGLPPIMARGVDAALAVGDVTYYFVEDQYLESTAPEVTRPLVERWGLVDNRIQSRSRIDAAFVAPDGRLYLFSGDQYATYSGPGREFVDEGCPLKIGDHLGQAWPAAFQRDIDSACVIDGRSHLFKGAEVVRFSDPAMRSPDRDYPRSIADKLVARPDFTLTSIPEHWRFKELSSAWPAFLQYLGDGASGLPELSSMAGWPAAEVAALLGGAALPGDGLKDGRTLSALAGHFAFAARLGATPSVLQRQLSDRLFGPEPHDLDAAADLAQDLLKAMTSPAEWPKLARALREPLNAARRDALVAYLVDARGLRDADELYEYLLNDVQTGPQATTSLVVEALGSAQLYYHRALMNLEEAPEPVRNELLRWWPWMKNYRTWEANRRVFLHPENYIRPELRKTRSQGFKELEQGLLQDQINDETASKAYTAYLEKFAEVSRLKTAGGYVYRDQTGGRTILMLGFARTEPLTYYHRFGRLPDDPKEPIAWQPWEKVNITIHAERVQPVFAFNRMFLFWFEREPVRDSISATEPAPPSAANTDAYRPVIKYSFYGLGGAWVQPQTLKADVVRPDGSRSWPAADIAQARLYVTNPSEASEYDPDAYNYVLLSIPNGGDTLLGRLSAALDFEPGVAISQAEATALTASIDLRATFPDRLGITPSSSMPWGAHFTGVMTSPWFSFEASGGSFLCRPVEPRPVSLDEVWPAVELMGRTFQRIDAAFRTRGGDLYVFTTEDGRPCCHHHAPGRGADAGSWRPPVFFDDQLQDGTPAWPWADQGNLFELDPALRITAAVRAGGKTYFVAGGQYFRYSSDDARCIDPGFPAPGKPPLATLVEGAARGDDFPWMQSPQPDLVNAFVDGDTLVVVTRSAEGALAYSQLTVDQLRSQVMATGQPLFMMGWAHFDAAFVAEMTGDRTLNVTQGRRVVCLSWKSRSWIEVDLGAFGVNVPGLSAALTGSDGALHLICGNQYAVASVGGAPAPLRPVAEKWGKLPPLYPEGALTGPDGEVYLFAGPRCVRYSNVDSAPAGGWVPDSGFPRPTSAVWGVAFDPVAAGFTQGGKTYVFGARGGASSYARYTRTSGGLQLEGGYPKRVQGKWGNLPTAFNLGFDASIPLPGRDGAADQLVLVRGGEMITFGGDTGPTLYETDEVKYSILRLSTNTSEQFTQRLISLGIPGLLSRSTQAVQELPRFATSGVQGQGVVVCTSTQFIEDYPGKPGGASPGTGLDFKSANGFYYWEIFFHVPYLVAQALNQQQRFEDARAWFEYVFDPTEKASGADTRPFWKFLPFHDASEGSDDRYLHDPDQLRLYRDDPFDPHALAQIRQVAYRKAFVMAYIDNVLDWGDLLFQQYTRESVGEATMLYVLAADLLGKKPEELGRRRLADGTLSYDQLTGRAGAVPEHLLELENATLVAPETALATPNDTVAGGYFYVPENEQFIAYWDRVRDRLYKIRAGLNIEGIAQALDLFAAPVDPAALVTGFATGSAAAALADRAGVPPHYRYSFMLGRARELAGRLVQLGGSLLSALEKRDAEDLSLLRNTQERAVLEATLQVKVRQLDGARVSAQALREGQKSALERRAHYTRLVAEGLSPFEVLQLILGGTAQAFSMISSLINIYASAASLIPEFKIDFAAQFPAAIGVVGGLQFGGRELSGMIGLQAQSMKRRADHMNYFATLVATLGGWDRRRQDWELQKAISTHDVEQLQKQIEAADIQVDVASREIEVQRRQIQNNASVDAFMKSKFTNRQLYQWMLGKLSAVYFQTYQLALEYARGAQRALQFEMGWPEEDAQYIGSYYWDNLRKGLLAGEQLQADLDRLEKAHTDRNKRRFEISKTVSLLQVDPMALLALKQKGRCEFELQESLFDSDFPGHYCRQLKSVSVSFPAIVGPYDNFNATVTQLSHRTVLEPDMAAVRYLLTAEGDQPVSIRSDWRPIQQVALSRGVNDSGLFQLNYQDERYLPFEGTGAVSRWRLEVNGVEGAAHRERLSDVILTVQYTSIAGGDDFAEKVKNALPPAGRARQLNLAYDFPQEWQAFLLDPARGMTFTVGRQHLPGAVQGAVSGLFLAYELTESGDAAIGAQSMRLNGSIDLRPGSLGGALNVPLGAWTLVPTGRADQFTPDNIRNVALLVGYTAKPTF